MELCLEQLKNMKLLFLNISLVVMIVAGCCPPQYTYHAPYPRKDCFDKAMILAKKFKARNPKEEVSVIIVIKKSNEYHAIVRCGDIYYDPSFKIISKNINDIGQYKVELYLEK